MSKKTFKISQVIPKAGFSRRLTLSFGAVILVVALAIPVAFLAFSDIRDASEEAARATRTLEEVGTLNTAIGDLRVTARDYADSPSDESLRKMNDQLARISQEARLMSQGKSRGGDSLITMSDPNRWTELLDEASKSVTTLRAAVEAGDARNGIRTFDVAVSERVQAPANELTDELRERGRKAQDAITWSTARSGIFLVLVLVAAVIVASLLALFVPRKLVRRLEDLRLTAHQLAHGDWTARAGVGDDASDEISDLVRDFNIMATMLQAREDENKVLQQQLHASLLNEQERATRDPLTGLRNHRYFQESLAAEIDRSGRTDQVVSIALLDLDNFKQVNDRFGHQEGDAVLLRVTQGITENLRPYDLAARLGGEEFGIIFPATAPADAKMVMDRIAAHILGFGPNGERATFSAGIATYPLHSEDQGTLYQLADASAYTAKSNGKAQTVIYDRRIVHEMNSEAQIEQKSREAVMQTAMTLASTVDTKDPYSRHHSELTAIYAGTIARALGMDEEMVKTVYRAGLLHDVGKVGIADEILKKPGPLTEEEWTQIRLHPELGFQILANADAEPVATWVRHHHEHWDGSGYPDRLHGDQIPIGSRIILVADAFEAMTSDRIYRRAITADEAILELTRCSGSQFDPMLAGTMVNLVRAGVFAQVWQQYGRQLRITPDDPTAMPGTDTSPQAA